MVCRFSSFCHWHQCWGLIFQALTPVITAIDTNARGYYCMNGHKCGKLSLWPLTTEQSYYCIHWHQCWGLFLQPETRILGGGIFESNTNAGGYYWGHQQQSRTLLLLPLIIMLGLLLWPQTPMLGITNIATYTNNGVHSPTFSCVHCGASQKCSRSKMKVNYDRLILNGLPNMLLLCDPLEVL